MSLDAKRAGAAEFDWYHTIDLGDGVVTAGLYDHRPLVPCYGLPDDLVGLSALDVGPAHGFFAFELEARGADPVVTVELPGGGGYGPPGARDPARVLEDVREGYVSLVEARAQYGVAIDPDSWTVLADETRELRTEMRTGGRVAP